MRLSLIHIFVAQSVGMDHVGPFTFNAVRSIIGGIVLIPCIFFLDHRKSDQKEELPSPQQQAEQTSTLILGGVCCGILDVYKRQGKMFPENIEKAATHTSGCNYIFIAS